MSELLKRGLSLVLAVFMVFSMVPVEVFAAEADSHEGHDHVVEEPVTPEEEASQPQAHLEEPEHTHVWVAGETVLATCTADGYTSYACECGEVKLDDIVPAAGHAWIPGEGVEATCTESGSMPCACACGETMQETLDPLGHEWDSVVVEPTADAQGYTRHTCTRCGDSYDDTFTSAEEPQPQEPALSEAYYALCQAMDAILVKYLGTSDPMTRDEMGDIVMANGEDAAREALAEVDELEKSDMMESISEDEVYLLVEENATFLDFVAVLESVFPEPSAIVDVAGGNISVTNSGGEISGDSTSVKLTVKVTAGRFDILGKDSTGKLTITNNTDKDAKISFAYAASGHESFTGPDGSSAASGVFTKTMAAGATATISITAKASRNSTATATVALDSFTWTEVKAASNVTFTFDATLGSVTVDGSPINSGDTKQISMDPGAVLVATPVEGYSFYGWMDGSGTVLSADATYTLQPAVDMAVKAVFAPDSVSEGPFKAGDYYFDDLNAAAAVSAANGTVVVLVQEYTLPAGEYTIPAGAKLLIPYDDANTADFDDTPHTGDAEERTTPSQYRRLTMASGAVINCLGAINVNAEQMARSNPVTSGVNGAYGAIQMESGSQINLQSGANLYCYGYIGGSGLVNAENGSNVYQMLQITDWRGGTATSSLLDEMKNDALMFSQFYFQNIEATLRVHSGSNMYGTMAIAAGLSDWKSPYQTYAQIVGKNAGMFHLSSGYADLTYRPGDDRMILDFHGRLVTDAISVRLNLGLSTQTINSKDYILGIPSNFTINIHDGSELSFAQKFRLLPGSEINIKSGAIATIEAGSEVHIYDADDWNSNQYVRNEASGNSTIAQITYVFANQGAPVSRNTNSNAVLRVDGSLTANGTVYTTKKVDAGGQAGITGNGRFINNTIGTRASFGEAIGNTTTEEQIPIIPAVGNIAGHGLASFSTDTYYGNGSGTWYQYTVTGTGFTHVSGGLNGASGTTDIAYAGAAYDVTGKTAVMNDIVLKLSDSKCAGTVTPALSESFVKGENGQYTIKGMSADVEVGAGDHVKSVVTLADTESTCAVQGYTKTQEQCANCDWKGAEQTVNKPISETHGTIVDIPAVAATCTKDGNSAGKKCTVCGTQTVVSKVIAKLGHQPDNPVEENHIAATCYADGSYDKVVYCTRETCDAENKEVSREIIAVKERPAHTPGTPVVEDRLEPTCFADGSYNEVTYCSVEGCGAKVSTAKKVLTKLEHQSVVVEPQDPTCTEEGWSVHMVCSLCGTVTNPSNGVKPVLPATGHNHTSKVTKDPTCLEEGVTTFTCGNAGCDADAADASGKLGVYTEPIAKLQHTTGETRRENEKQPTCYADGSYDNVVYCGLNCGTPLSTTTVPLTDRPQHTPAEAVKENEKAATCYADGSYNSVVYCSVAECQYKISSTPVTVSMTTVAHTPAEAVKENEKAATCYADGSYESVVYCSVEGCKAQISRETVAVEDRPAHTPAEAVQENVVPATCYKDGSYESVVYCSVAECKAEISRKTETIGKDTVAHTPAEAVQENPVAATCWKDGSYESVIYCSMENCKAVISRETVAVKDRPAHTPAEAVQENLVAATCWKDGSYESVVYCSVAECKAEISRKTETISQDTVAHTPAEAVKENEVPATCWKDGSYDSVVYCAVEECHKQLSKTTVPVSMTTVAHTPAEAVKEKEVAATCYADGSYDNVIYCSVEGCETEISRETVAVQERPAHTPGEAVQENIVPATCYDEGSYDEVVYCSVANCHAKISTMRKTIEKIAHTPAAAVREKEVKPTCYADGSYESVVYCSVEACKAKISSETIEVTQRPAHTPADAVRENEVAATCYENGSYDSVVYCSVEECKSEISRETVTISKDTVKHTSGEPVKENEEPATCYENGSYDSVTYCSVEGCGAEIKRTTVTISKDTVEHTSGEAVRENVNNATCYRDGSYDEVVYCSVTECKEELSRTKKTIDKGTVEHTPGQAVNESVTAATCYAEGSYNEVVYCSVAGCNEKLSSTPKTIEKIAHTPAVAVEENRVEALCYKNGSYDNVVYCAVEKCHEELSRDTVTISKDTVAHTPGETKRENEIQPPSCTENGSYEEAVYCTVCNAEMSRDTKVIVAKHKWVTNQVVKEPTCTEAGEMAGAVCTVCQEETDVAEISALGHSFTSEVTTEPTCYSTGVKTYTCQRENCDNKPDADGHTGVYTEPIKKIAHTPTVAVEENRVEALCYKDGSYESVVYCSVEGCKAVISRETVAVKDRPAHTPAEAVQENLVAATCWKDGSYESVVYCSVAECKAEISRKTETISQDTVAHTPAEAVKENEVPATCWKDGSYDSVVYCAVEECRKELSRTGETISKHLVSHNAAQPVYENEVDATCHSDGSYEKVVYCSVTACKAEISRKTITVTERPAHVPALAVRENVIAATCWKDGSYDSVVYCSVTDCKAEISREEKTVTKDTVAHTPAHAVREKEVAATCYKEGSYESVVYCSVAECKHEISRTGGVISKTKHTPAEAVKQNEVPATCYANGSYDAVVYCAVPECKAELSRSKQTVSKETIKHTPAAAVKENEVPATCYADGSYDSVIYCSVAACKAEISREKKAIGKDTVKHTSAPAVQENTVPATCYEDGSYEEVVYCAVEACKAEISREKKVISKDTVKHTHSTAVKENEVAATCYADGSYDSVVYCSVAECQAEIKRTEITVKKETVAHTPAEAVEENRVEALCYKNGSYDSVVYCSVAECKHEISRIGVVINKSTVAHTPAEAVQESVVSATCYKEGSYNEVVYCSVVGCKEKLSSTPKTIEKITHTPAAAVKENEVPATCYADGSYDSVIYCSVAACKAEISREEKTIGKDTVKHTSAPAVQENTVPATCYADGSYEEVVYCAVEACKAEISREEKTIGKDTVKHTSAEAVRENVVDATCTIDGSYDEVIYCALEECKVEVSRDKKTIGATGHTYDEGVVTRETSCSKEGEKTFTCQDPLCDEGKDSDGHGKTYTVAIPKSKHTNGTIVGTPATCTNSGLTDGYGCLVCGEMMLPQEEIKAKGHTPGDPVEENRVAPTCTEDGGYDEVVYCAVATCGEELERKAHTVEKTGHTGGEAVREHVVHPDCTNKGSHDEVVYCVNKNAGVACGHEISRIARETEAKGHTDGSTEKVVTNAATCTEVGSYDLITYCAVCNKIAKREPNEIPATGHTEVDIPAVETSCKAPGYTVGTKCSFCQTVLTAPEKIEQLPHTPVVIPAKAPTCQAVGAKEGSKCSVCDEILVAPEEIPVVGHDYGAGSVTIAPNCTEDGVRTFTCAMCKDVKTSPEPALGHDLETIPARKPTYKEAGWEEYQRCINEFSGDDGISTSCGYSTKVEIPALGEPTIASFDEFIENLGLLEDLAYKYVTEVSPGKDPASLVIKYIRTGVERYNSGSWNIMAGYEDKDFAAYVEKEEASYNLELAEGLPLRKVSGMKNLELFSLPSGDQADIGHVFGLMDISYTSSVNCDVSGWGGDTVDLLSAADQYGVEATTVEEMTAEIARKYFLKSGEMLQEEFGEEPIEGSFSDTDVRGDLDGYYIIKQLTGGEYYRRCLTDIFSGYMTESLSDYQRSDYFLKNRLGGVTLRSDVREAVFNAYSGDKPVVTLESTRTFKADSDALMNLRKAVCNVFADYLCKNAGDYVEDTGNNYYEVFDINTSTLAPGVTQKIVNVTTSDNKTMIYYTATADVTRSDVDVYVNSPDNNPPHWAMQRVLDQSLAAQAKYSDPSNPKYIENFNIVAAINGDGYNMYTGQPSGLVAMEGVEWNPPSYGVDFFAMLKDGSAVVGSYDEYQQLKAAGKIKEAIGAFGGTMLIKNGKINISQSGDYWEGRASRTAIGVTATGRVVFMVVDGRQEGLSCGASIAEIAQIMFDAGCYNAINLDGGGSTTYIAKPEGESELQLVNNPSDGNQRSVANSLFIASTAPSSTAFDHAVLDSEYRYLTPGATTKVEPKAVSATGNPVEMPEGTTWASSNNAVGTVDETGVFTAKGTGPVTISLMLGDKAVGTRELYVVNPDNVYFASDKLSAIYNEPIKLPVKAVYDNKPVAITEKDVVLSLVTPQAGTVEGFTFTGTDESFRIVEVIATLAHTVDSAKPVTGKLTVNMFRMDEASFDFDNVTGGNREFAFLRDVSNADETAVDVYRVVDREQPMVTTYTFALDMSVIPVPEKLNELTYMLPGADQDDASAWNFLLKLAERVSVLTNVTPELVFDQRFDVDYSEITVSNEYFTLDKEKISYDPETNVLKLRLNWVDQEQPIEPSTANPLCVVSGIKLTPKADADWGSNETIKAAHYGNISYDIYLRANALYSFAMKPENQEEFGLLPFENKDVIIGGTTEKGGHFQEVYTTFSDTYSLIKGIKEGWIMEDGGWAFYEDGQRYTGYAVVDGLYYDFGVDGINIGQKPHTGVMILNGAEYYAVAGVLYKGWMVVDIKNVSYYNEETGVKESLDKDEVPSTCIVDGHCDYTSESGATKHIDYDDAGGHDWNVLADGTRKCKVCEHVRINMEDTTATLSFYTCTYSGLEKKPGTTVKTQDGKILTKPPTDYFDYYTEYTNNIEVGTASATMKAQRWGKYADLNDWFGDYAGSITVNFEIRPDLPTNVVIDVVDDQARISWTAAKAPGVTYVLYKSPDGTNWASFAETTELSYTVNPSDIAQHQISIRTVKTVDDKTYESLARVKAVYLAPVVISDNRADTGKPRLSWTGLTNDPTYYVYRATSVDGEFTKVDYKTKYNTYTHLSASAGKVYFYKIQAEFADGSLSGFSNVVSGVWSCTAPTVEVVEDSAGKPVLTWDEVDRAESYAIYRCDTMDGSFVEVGETEELNWNDTTAVPGVTYFYRVRARSADGVEGIDSKVVSNDPDAPLARLHVVAAINETSGKPTLKWNALEGEVKQYEVFRATSLEGTYKKYYTTQGSSYTHLSAIPGSTYYYYVRGVLADGNVVLSEIFQQTCEIRFNIEAKLNEKIKPNLKWDWINGAQKYTVYVYNSTAALPSRTFETKGNSYTNTAAQVGRTYYYKLKVDLSNGKSFTSPFVAVECKIPEVTFNIITGNNMQTGKPTLRWDPIVGAQKYNLYYAQSAEGPWTKSTFETKGTTYTNTAAQAGKLYYYKLEVTLTNGNKVMSHVVSNSCLIPSYELTVEKSNNAVTGKPTLKWNPIIGAERYEVHRSRSANGEFTKVFETTSNTYTHLSATEGTTYYYKVKVLMVDGTSTVSEIITNTCLKPA